VDFGRVGLGRRYIKTINVIIRNVVRMRSGKILRNIDRRREIDRCSGLAKWDNRFLSQEKGRTVRESNQFS